VSTKTTKIVSDREARFGDTGDNEIFTTACFRTFIIGGTPDQAGLAIAGT